MIGPPVDTSLEPAAIERIWSKVQVTGFCWLLPRLLSTPVPLGAAARHAKETSGE